MFFGVGADKERWDVDHLLSDTDVALADQNSGVMDGFGEV